MDAIEPGAELALPPGVRMLTTLRGGGVSRPPYDDGAGGGGFNLALHVGDREPDVLRNRAALRAVLPSEPAWLTQVHGTAALDAAAVGDAPEADASFSAARGVVCAILTADCLPVLFWDEAGRVVGAAHAGWRGLACGVLQSAVAGMRRAGAGELRAWLGPAIGPTQFEVGDMVPQAFAGQLPDPSAFRPRSGAPGKYLADIYQLARSILAKQGISRVYGGDFCTVTDRARFYSYRRDGATGRMASLIWMES
jgi:YfiH family protein